MKAKFPGSGSGLTLPQDSVSSVVSNLEWKQDCSQAHHRDEDSKGMRGSFHKGGSRSGRVNRRSERAGGLPCFEVKSWKVALRTEGKLIFVKPRSSSKI